VACWLVGPQGGAACRSRFLEWVLLPGPSDEGASSNDDEGAAPSCLLVDLLRELERAYASRRHYDPDAVRLFQRIGLTHAEAGRFPQALASLRQAVWGAYRFYLATRNPEPLVDAMGSLVHGRVLGLFSGSAASSTADAEAVAAAGRQPPGIPMEVTTKKKTTINNNKSTAFSFLNTLISACFCLLSSRRHIEPSLSDGHPTKIFGRRWRKSSR